MKVKAALLVCTLLAATTAAQSQSYFDAEDTAAVENAQTSSHLRDHLPICKSIEKIVSPEFVFYPGSVEYKADMSHWANSSSNRVATCSVRPGRAEEVGKILRELDSTRTPFAIRCSGHTGNPGFSSTRGVQISMIRFNEIVLSKDEKTVEVGAGLDWTAVYQHLVPKGLNVVGGRLNGVGLAGFTLGGGYSWKTNQYGLTIDTVTAFELVLPNGSVKKVTEKDEDLWFALKGGLNNYGIVTKFTFETHKQTDVWGAVLAFAGDQLEPAYKAFADFTAKDNHRKGAQLGAIAYSNGTVGLGIVLFYDAPEPPAGLYDPLLNLPNSAKAIIKGSFLDFVSSLPPPVRARAYFDGVPFLHYSEPVLKVTAENLQSWGDRIKEKDEDTLIVLNLDAFENDIFTHGGPSAYPPDRSHTILPSSLYFGWTNEALDEYMGANLRALSAELIQAGIKDYQDLKHASHYTNYALFGTPLSQMYGNNVDRLREIRKKYDPHRVMDLTGGFKFRF